VLLNFQNYILKTRIRTRTAYQNTDRYCLIWARSCVTLGTTVCKMYLPQLCPLRPITSLVSLFHKNFPKLWNSSPTFWQKLFFSGSPEDAILVYEKCKSQKRDVECKYIPPPQCNQTNRGVDWHMHYGI